MFTFGGLDFSHEEGTKYYAIRLLTNDSTGKTVLVQNWGRIHTSGQIKNSVFSSRQAGQNAVNDIVRKRKQRGYSVSVSKPDVSISSQVRLKDSDVMGGLFSRVELYLRDQMFFNSDDGMAKDEDIPERKEVNRSGMVEWGGW